MLAAEINFCSKKNLLDKFNLERVSTWDCQLMTSDIKVGRGVQVAPQIGRHRVGQGR